MTRKTYKGRFSPINPQKYKGDPTNIIFRSSYELKVMKYLDTTPEVIEWSSEEVVVPYISPKDGKRHRYFPDFLVKIKTGDDIKTLLVEVKPAKETREPVKKKRITKQYVSEVVTWAVNSKKWEAATEYAKDRGWEFKILTEAEIFGRKINK